MSLHGIHEYDSARKVHVNQNMHETEIKPEAPVCLLADLMKTGDCTVQYSTAVLESSMRDESRLRPFCCVS